MYNLSSADLSVNVLDPVADNGRFGTRYCTGGYIFQVEDAKVGPLLTGPTFPDSFNVYDGQGIPDAFSRAPLRDPDSPDRALVPGIGLCDLTADSVVEFCVWDVRLDVRAAPTSIRMNTTQSLGSFAFDLEREVSLNNRSLCSRTRIRNTGRVGFPISWFPHPFFPHPEGDELCRLNIPFVIRENPGYEMSAGGYIARRNWPWGEGYYHALDHEARSPLVVLQKHPKLGLIAGTTSYVPCFFPIWGNRNTFSWEPYFERTVAPGQEVEWWVVYDF
jgi:hypothetical protein